MIFKALLTNNKLIFSYNMSEQLKVHCVVLEKKSVIDLFMPKKTR